MKSKRAVQMKSQKTLVTHPKQQKNPIPNLVELKKKKSKSEPHCFPEKKIPILLLLCESQGISCCSKHEQAWFLIEAK
ncbi:hypothetical protein V6N13_015766 [Hibiscus sabdariffa]